MRRGGRHGQAGSPRPGLPALGALGLTLLLAVAGCADSGGFGSIVKQIAGTISPAPYTTTSVLTPGNVTTVTSGTVDVSADVLADALSMGIVVQSSGPSVLGFIEHDGLFLGMNDKIKGPKGAVPYAFHMFDSNGDGTHETPVPVAVNNEAAALHFPNDGTNTDQLEAGNYKFPVGAADSSGELVVDTLTPFVYYKRETGTVPTLKLNVFVLEGVDPGITDDASAGDDAEIQGAITVLENVYANNPNVALNLDVGVHFLPSATSGDDGNAIITESEQLSVLASVSSSGSDCSAPPDSASHDAMNIFVIEGFDSDYLGPGVIGLAAGIPGPFNRHCTATSGTLAVYQYDEDDGVPVADVGTILGFTLAHEFGHFLGLFHTSQTAVSGGEFVINREDPIADTALCTTEEVQQAGDIDNCPDRDNLMFPFVDENADPPVSVGQGNVIKYNPAITVP